jgi:hypothetical protein
MTNKKIIRQIQYYILQNKSVDIKWFIRERLNLEKNDREIDIIYVGVLNCFWFSDYKGHNPSDISIRLNPSRWAVLIGVIGGILGIFAFILTRLKW